MTRHPFSDGAAKVAAATRRYVSFWRHRDIGDELAEMTGQTPTIDRVNQWGLVLASRGIPYRLSRHGHLGRLSVSRRFHEIALQTLLAEPHDGTEPDAPRLALAHAFQGGHPLATLVIFFGLLVFHGLTQGWWVEVWPAQAWLEAGALNAAAVWQRHEWYRLVTALTLHAGSLHLFSNLAFGAVVMLILCRRTGTGPGWLAAVLAGAAGNLIMVCVRQSDYVSVGFSTAIFGGMGVLCGLEMALFRSQGWRSFLVPLAVGGAWLGLLGGGGQEEPAQALEEPFSPLPATPAGQVDVGAHVTGFLAGLPLGALIGVYLGTHPAPSLRASWTCGGLALGLVAGAWALALL